MKMADEVGLEPWELGKILIKISIRLYKKMGKEQILSLEETPTELVKEYVQDMIIKESE
ncbi:hypothetical protein [Methanobacterium sp.]|uniref:hypothetical protein n=1 Tax=Methanobacterium sp. TaxID=2164 RepID=UPI002AB936DD|nr:hypothetical protein [Methanobacterium sp.]MDY9924321.1 hypothetical protein [Methanobacterium sp.]